MVMPQQIQLPPHLPSQAAVNELLEQIHEQKLALARAKETLQSCYSAMAKYIQPAVQFERCLFYACGSEAAINAISAVRTKMSIGHGFSHNLSYPNAELALKLALEENNYQSLSFAAQLSALQEEIKTIKREKQNGDRTIKLLYEWCKYWSNHAMREFPTARDRELVGFPSAYPPDPNIIKPYREYQQPRHVPTPPLGELVLPQDRKKPIYRVDGDRVIISAAMFLKAHCNHHSTAPRPRPTSWTMPSFFSLALYFRNITALFGTSLIHQSFFKKISNVGAEQKEVTPVSAATAP